MSTATVSSAAPSRQVSPVSPVSSVSPIVSNQEWNAHILAQLAAGEITQEAALAAIRQTAAAPKAAPAVRARRTAKGALWISLGYRAEPGKQNSTTLPREGWEAVVRLVKDGTIPGFLASYDTIPLSASALKGGE
jgi:hypothetical protein